MTAPLMLLGLQLVTALAGSLLLDLEDPLTVFAMAAMGIGVDRS